MHRISYVKIENFRACRNVSLPLEGYTPLVGQNNAGKSTILEALQWVLKPSVLAASDFADSSKSVVVTACIEGVSNELLDCITVPKHRSAIEPYCQEEKLWIRVEATGTTAKTISRSVWDVENMTGIDPPDAWRDYPTGLPEAVSVLLPDPLYIQAMQDVGEDLGKAKAGTTIKNLLDEIMQPILEAHKELAEAMDTIKNILTKDGDKRSEHLNVFDQQASESLEKFFPGLSLDLDLKMVQVNDFFKAGDLYVTDNVTGDRRKFDQIGTGAQRSIQMALVRHLAGARKKTPQKASRRLLLVDEPELYLHPQGVRRLREALADLSKSGYQVIFSSHSPFMLSRDNAADTVIVRKDSKKGTLVKKPLRQAVVEALEDAPAQARVLFELGNLADLYFTDRIVICEGETDRRLLPVAYERLYGHAPELDHIAFISLGSCSGIPKALPVLKVMGIKACAIADLDFAFTHARSGNKSLLPENDENIMQAKTALIRLQKEAGFTLNGNGLPVNDKKAGMMAADTWALLAQDDEGKKVTIKTQEALTDQNVWVWSKGCIEQITGATDKGESAITDQEKKLHGMETGQIGKEMPEFKQCFEWIRGL